MSTQVHQRGPANPVTMGGAGSTPIRNRTVRRCLFGPPDPLSTSEYARRKRLELQAKSSSDWNFDFEAEKPRPGPLKWEAVGKNNTSACVPKPYALSRLPFLSTRAETTTLSPLPRVIHHEPLLCPGVTSPMEESSRLGGEGSSSTTTTSATCSGGPPSLPPTPAKSEGRCGSPEEDRLQGSSGSSQSSLSPECPPSFPSPPTSLEESSSPPNSPTGGAPRTLSSSVMKPTSSQPRITQFLEQRKRSNVTKSSTSSPSAAKKKKAT